MLRSPLAPVAASDALKCAAANTLPSLSPPEESEVRTLMTVLRVLAIRVSFIPVGHDGLISACQTTSIHSSNRLETDT